VLTVPEDTYAKSFCVRHKVQPPNFQVLLLPGLKQPERKPDLVLFFDIYITNGPTWQIRGAVVRQRANFVSLYFDLPHTSDALTYRGADKSLARPGRKQATATEDFDFHISYL
jgi:hypothetical protein